MTQIEAARRGQITEALKIVADAEGRRAEDLLPLVADGRIVIPCNPRHAGLRPAGIGKSLRTKVNVNLGTSKDFPALDKELEKVGVCLAHRADALMDLSTGGDIPAIRREILKRAPLPLGTVPLYQTAVQAIEERGSILDMTVEDMFASVEAQAREGVDFMTIHCGLTMKAVERLRRQGRTADVVSRGGAFHVAWMLHHQRSGSWSLNSSGGH